MRGLVIFLLVLIGIASFSFIAISAKSVNDTKTDASEKPKILDFGTFTSAVCENKGDIVRCTDEVFVKCNGKISRAVDIAECNGFKIDVPKATGAAVFGSGWKDPRIN